MDSYCVVCVSILTRIEENAGSVCQRCQRNLKMMPIKSLPIKSLKAKLKKASSTNHIMKVDISSPAINSVKAAITHKGNGRTPQELVYDKLISECKWLGRQKVCGSWLMHEPSDVRIYVQIITYSRMK